jgi:hypothetical protein
MRILLYDNTQGFMSWIWWLGSFLSSWDHKAGVASWDEAITEAAKCRAPVREIQFWGHGVAGSPLINGFSVSSEMLYGLAEAARFRRVANPFIWFRCCEVFSRSSGERFAIAAVRATNATIIAHTRVIGIFQSGGYALRPGECVWWDSYEGIDNNTGRTTRSQPWYKNTIFAFRMSVPHSWWR